MRRGFERVYDSLQEFHAFFAASFGRKQWRDHSGNYLQALLVQDQERRNAENLSESVGISARAMQRFLTEARWSDETVIGRLQEYLAPRLNQTPGGGVGVRWQRLPQAGQEIGGSGPAVLRQAGQGGQTARVGCSWPTSARWAGRWWTSGCICPRVGPPTRTGVLRRVCRRTGRNYRSKTELALEMLERVLELGYLRAEWVAGDDAFGMSPTFREGLAALGMRYVLDVPGGTTVWPLDPAWTSPEYTGFGRPRKPKLRPGQRRTMVSSSSAVMNCRMRLGGR